MLRCGSIKTKQMLAVYVIFEYGYIGKEAE